MRSTRARIVFIIALFLMIALYLFAQWINQPIFEFDLSK